MNKKLLILAMGDLTKQNKAPTRRMRAIIDNFERIREPYCTISGNRKQRSRRAKKLLISNDLRNIKGAYIESTNSGMIFYEFLLLLRMKLKRIPISVYIRDGYPLFKEYWSIRFYRQIIANILWIISYYCYRMLVDIMYFPSELLMSKFKFRNKKLLIPGISSFKHNLGTQRIKSVFYTGGIGQQYDVQTFLKACKKLSEEMDISVTMFCRESEVFKISKWKNEQWLSIQHKNLEELDFQPMIGVIPLVECQYSDLAFPVKLLDYVSINTVILASNSIVTKNYINKNKIGVIVNSGDVNDYYSKIKELFNNEELYNSLKKNMLDLKESKELTWETRCKQIIRDLNCLK